MNWQLTDKGDPRCRALADRHYSRQTIGATSFTRPGYNYVLYTADSKGEAVYVWWRPKWESGIKGTNRFDNLHCLECTIFRNETSILSSQLIIEACAAVQTWEHYLDQKLEHNLEDGLITSVNSKLTTKQRSINSQPGMCFIHAGFQPLTPHHIGKGTADTWLYLPPQIYPPIEHPLSLVPYTVIKHRSPMTPAFKRTDLLTTQEQ